MAWRVREGYVAFLLTRPSIDICVADFRRRFLSLLSFKFREFGSVTALSVLEATNAGVKALDAEPERGAVPMFLVIVGGVADD